MSDPSPPVPVLVEDGDDALPDVSRGDTASAEALEYARRLFQNVMEWYKSADTKAQIILTIDGAFIAFLTGSMFTEPVELRATAAEFSQGTWTLLLLMSLSLGGSMISALACLWSRIYLPGEVTDQFREWKIDVKNAGSYRPEVMWFFQFVRHLEPEQLRARLLRMDPAAEVGTLAFQIPELSANVTRKHAWVNAGFVLAGASFLFFLAAGISYVAGL